MPWGWAAERGILDRWAKRYGLSIEVVQINDYVESINQDTVGAFDGCTMTNMDALTIPAVGGVDSVALIVGDFSNGNDGTVSKTASDLRALRGEPIHLVELSVSHYLLARALESVGLAERDVTIVNTSDADILAVFKASSDVRHIVTWNPCLRSMSAAHADRDATVGLAMGNVGPQRRIAILDGGQAQGAAPIQDHDAKRLEALVPAIGQGGFGDRRPRPGRAWCRSPAWSGRQGGRTAKRHRAFAAHAKIETVAVAR